MPPRHLGAAEHEEEAARNEREAAEHEAVYASQRRQEASPTSISCVDTAFWVPDPTSGAERLPVLRPCWTSEQRPSEDQLREAREHRRAAAAHRAAAAALRRAERQACGSLGEDEISHSPFYHRQDVLRVDPIASKEKIEGARIVFRKVPGLDARWMREAITCHQARAAALGYPSTFMTYCPLMVAPTTAVVEENADTVSVTIRAARDEQAAAILGRAQDLLPRVPR